MPTVPTRNPTTCKKILVSLSATKEPTDKMMAPARRTIEELIPVIARLSLCLDEVDMPDILRKGTDWLADQLTEHASRSVKYSQGDDSVEVQATIGRSLLKLNDGYGAVYMQWTDRDFLIQGEDLVLAGSVELPQRGDVIRETEGATTHVFEVMAPGGEPPWRWSDSHRKLLRIHTKKIATEE